MIEFLLQISDCKFGWLSVLAICLMLFINGLFSSVCELLDAVVTSLAKQPANETPDPKP